MFTLPAASKVLYLFPRYPPCCRPRLILPLPRCAACRRRARRAKLAARYCGTAGRVTPTRQVALLQHRLRHWAWDNPFGARDTGRFRRRVASDDVDPDFLAPPQHDDGHVDSADSGTATGVEAAGDANASDVTRGVWQAGSAWACGQGVGHRGGSVRGKHTKRTEGHGRGT